MKIEDFFLCVIFAIRGNFWKKVVAGPLKRKRHLVLAVVQDVESHYGFGLHGLLLELPLFLEKVKNLLIELVETCWVLRLLFLGLRVAPVLVLELVVLFTFCLNVSHFL